jgi:preprotein translocase subunit SecD
MKIRWCRFNIYLALGLALAAVCGCKTSGEPNPKKLLSTLRLHLEVSRDGTKSSEPVPIFREKPVMVNAELKPFLTEGNVAEAKVIDVVGGYALLIRFDHEGTTLLEECTISNRGRRIAVFSQFGEKIKDNRWLAAPVIIRRVTDGVFTFTPDASREECEEIAAGLNNVSKKVHTWSDE